MKGLVQSFFKYLATALLIATVALLSLVIGVTLRESKATRSWATAVQKSRSEALEATFLSSEEQ